jgi:hypothetical protein
MWLPVLALVFGVVVGLATGGRPRWAARRQLRSAWLVVAGVVMELASSRWSLGPAGEAAFVGGYVLLLAFAWRNRRLRGVRIAAVGLVCNVAVIVANAGMPVSPRAVVAAGIVRAGDESDVNYGHRHHAQRASDSLTWLDDRIPLRLAHSVVSIGDVLLSVGVAVVVVEALHYQARYQRRRLRPLLKGRS